MRHIIKAVVGLVLALAVLPALAASGKLVIYTSQPNQDAQQTVDAFRKLHPDVEVEWIRDGTTKVMAKLRAEFAAGDPKPDVLLIADTVTMEGLKQQDRLLAHPDAPTDAYDAGLHDTDKQYFSTKLITTGIVYNTNAQMQPASWKDLTAAQARNLVAMPRPLYSGAALIHLATLTDNTDLGWNYYQELAANGASAESGNGGVFKAFGLAGGLAQPTAGYDLRRPSLRRRSRENFAQCSTALDDAGAGRGHGAGVCIRDR